MKIIEKSLEINIALASFIVLLFIVSCSKNKMEKKEFIDRRGIVKKEHIHILKSNKWKLEKVYIYDNTDLTITSDKRIRFDNFNNKTIEFREKGVYINGEFVGDAIYKVEIFTLNRIDTLTNNFYLYKLKNNILTLKNDVGYYKDNKLLKRYSIELILAAFKKDNNSDLRSKF